MHRTRIAYLSLPTHFQIASVVPLAEAADHEDLTPLLSKDIWRTLLETGHLPQVQSCILDGQTQALAVSHCIHFLVENSVTDQLVRFSRSDRRKTRPWLWKSQLRVRYQTLPKSQMLATRSPFGAPLSLIHEQKSRREGVFDVMTSVLKALPRLLIHATPSSQLVFAIRVGSSLVCSSKMFLDLWHEAQAAMKRYLVSIAGLNSRKLALVAPSNTWRQRGWAQFKEARSLSILVMRKRSTPKN